MTPLVKEDEVAAALGYGTALLAQMSPVLKPAIKRATQRVEVELGYPLEATTCTDLFFPDVSLHLNTAPGGVLKLLLSRQYLSSSVTVVALPGYPSDTSAEEVTVVNADLAAGEVLVSEVHDKKWLRATYTSGFSSGDTCPDAIKRAIIAYVPWALMLASPMLSDSEEKTTSKVSSDQAGSALVLTQRTSAFAYLPMVSSYVPAP